jgi:hypothetical protein
MAAVSVFPAGSPKSAGVDTVGILTDSMPVLQAVPGCIRRPVTTDCQPRQHLPPLVRPTTTTSSSSSNTGVSLTSTAVGLQKVRCTWLGVSQPGPFLATRGSVGSRSGLLDRRLVSKGTDLGGVLGLGMVFTSRERPRTTGECSVGITCTAWTAARHAAAKSSSESFKEGGIVTRTAIQQASSRWFAGT